MISINKEPFSGWNNSLHVSNDKVELVIPLDFGPRILSYGFIGGENQFQINTEEAGITGDHQWHLYGGHRLWIAPEDPVRTLHPDNLPISCEQSSEGVCLSARVESTTNFQKSIRLCLDDTGTHVELQHRLRNCSDAPQTAAPWAITVMRSGGVAILPIGDRRDWPAALTAQNTLSLWSYTRLADPRWRFGNRYILLHQDVNRSNPQKMGMHNTEGWAAHINNGVLFIKTFSVNATSNHPDLNSNLEVFTNDRYLEIETLGPNQKVEPGDSITLREDWYLFPDIPNPVNDEDVDQTILPLIIKIQSSPD